MGKENLLVKKYKDEYESLWDDFVNNKSINGTFLHTRKFLNYHPKERFKDASIIVFEDNSIVALIPACELDDSNGIELYSHKGATYGGIITDKKHYKTEKLIKIVNVLDDYFRKHYKKVTLKITASIHSIQPSDLLEYVLSNCGYENYSELNTFIGLRQLPENILLSFDKNKQRNIKKCMEHNLAFRELKESIEIDEFYELLKINLSKFNKLPIHTLNELNELREKRTPSNVRFYGCFSQDKMMAGSMMFIFEKVNVIHAQYLASNYKFSEYSPMSYLYYSLIEQARMDGYKAITWGISTENEGKDVNLGLIRNKESYGSQHQLNRTFYKIF